MARLPRLPRTPMVDPKTGTPSQAFTVYWQRFAEAQEATDAAQDVLIADVQAVQTQLAAMVATLNATVIALATAVDQIRLNTSYTQPTSILTAAEAGTTASITIANHVRRYGDNSSLSIIGGTISGLLTDTRYAVYYIDESLADTTPTFLATADFSAAQIGAAPGIHPLGVIRTPIASSGDTFTGGGAYPPGGNIGGELQ